ncbi:MAG: 16S rRNA (cytosine(1402)-N(4))-methyltransferase RsmH [Clostridia bacterium]|nr:16S rRNA (cytosine(1402)-N(4))-methyltransferase RsmH [Clostridia bacterium]
MEFHHVSVLLDECLEGLAIKPDGVYIDGTLGGAGHSSHILEKLGKGGLLIGIDQDGDALAVASERLSKVQTEGAFKTVRANFSEMDAVCEELGIDGVDGILLDIGVSSYQFDTEDRGFSYRFDAKLDMRMDRRNDFTAYDIVNKYSEKEIADVIFRYGEEKWAKRIASFIVEERRKAPVETTFQLVEIIKKAIPAAARRDGHPAKRTFQALRIEVNRELDVLAEAIEKAIKLLKPQGRLCIITFHSLEEKLVKQLFKEAERPCTCPPDFPVCVCGKKSLGKTVTSKPILPTENECIVNPRSKSAKLRIFERK